MASNGIADPVQDQSYHPRLGIVVPLANEETTVESFLKAVVANLEERDSVFCILDNVSKDSTREKIEAAAAIDSRIELIWAPENRGLVDAYFRGYREALQADCDWILEMDGGFSHHPDEIPLFREAMQSGADFAAGSRFVRGGSHQGSVSRMLVSWIGTVLTNSMLGTRMKDMTSGFECFTRDALQHVIDQGVRSRWHFFQTEIRYLLRDWNWVEVPITYSNPSPSLGSAPLKEALRNLWWLSRQRKQSA